MLHFVQHDSSKKLRIRRNILTKRDKIGQAQLEILRYIQDNHPVTVRQVADFVAGERGVTRTTAST